MQKLCLSPFSFCLIDSLLSSSLRFLTSLLCFPFGDCSFLFKKLSHPSAIISPSGPIFGALKRIQIEDYFFRIFYQRNQLSVIFILRSQAMQNSKSAYLKKDIRPIALILDLRNRASYSSLLTFPSSAIASGKRWKLTRDTFNDKIYSERRYRSQTCVVAACQLVN